MAPSPSRLAGALTAFWFGLASFLEREAGHTMTAIMLVWIAIQMSDQATRSAAAHDLMIYALGMISKGMGNGKAEKP
jgi:hypothetical protein